MKIALIILFSICSIVGYSIEKDSTFKPIVEHQIGVELLGKGVWYSIFYEIDRTFLSDANHFGFGYGINTTSSKGLPKGRYIGNIIETYYSYGMQNQIKFSLSHNLDVKITNLKPSEIDGKKADFFNTSSIGVGYIRKLKKSQFTFGANVFGMMQKYKIYSTLNNFENQTDFFLLPGINIQYKIR